MFDNTSPSVDEMDRFFGLVDRVSADPETARNLAKAQLDDMATLPGAPFDPDSPEYMEALTRLRVAELLLERPTGHTAVQWARPVDGVHVARNGTRAYRDGKKWVLEVPGYGRVADEFDTLKDAKAAAFDIAQPARTTMRMAGGDRFEELFGPGSDIHPPSTNAS